MEARVLNINKGYVTLMSVLVASAVVVSIAVGILVLGINSTRTASAIQSTKFANTLARSCAEEALKQIRNSSGYTGSGNLSFSQGLCDYNVTNTGGQNRLVTATGTAVSAIRRISITLNAITPKINVSSSQEVADF
ncbi:MAG: hypothetical protein Q8L47_03565 [bacterium]|nr:hypothetical protein [bacterium]